jgi:hypothetical protein
MGINVQNKVDKTTHFLIVGAELWNDPATGEPLAEPMQPSDLPEYKQGESLGVQVIPLQDIRDYFRPRRRTVGEPSMREPAPDGGRWLAPFPEARNSKINGRLPTPAPDDDPF